MALVEAAKYYTLIEARLAEARLGAEEIGCVLFDAEMHTMVPVRLMVDDEDLARARLILDDQPR
jgi:putative signal transducing protein